MGNVHLKRHEAVAVLKDLENEALILTDSVVIEKVSSDRYQLKLKGCYDIKTIENYLKYSNLVVKESEGYLLIFSA